jgi:hypothetical protein
MVENQKEEVVPIFAKILLGSRLFRQNLWGIFWVLLTSFSKIRLRNGDPVSYYLATSSPSSLCASMGIEL